MKIHIKEHSDAQDTEIIIVCQKIDNKVRDIVVRLRMFNRKLTGVSEGVNRIVRAEDVFYVESVDKHTFVYTLNEVLETSLRLYEMEERLADCDFLRISRSCVVNFNKIVRLCPDINGRLIATMENGEQLVVSRHYASDVRRKLDLL